MALFSILFLLAGFLAWLGGSEAGGHFLADHAERWSQGRLIVSGWQGRLLGHWQVARLELRLPSGHFLAEHLDIDWRAPSLWRGHLDIARLSLGRLSLHMASSDAPARLPASLELPIELRLGSLELQELRWGSLPQTGEDLVFREIRAGLESRRGVHVLSSVSGLTPWGRLSGEARMAQRSPFALLAQLELATSLDERHASVLARAEGELARPRLHLQANSDEQKGLSGEADLQLHPFEPLPLSQAWVSIKGLDPSVFHASAPKALLDLQADLRSSFVADPASKHLPAIEAVELSGPLSISNRLPGLIEDKALPIETLRANLDWGRGRLSLSSLFLSLPGKGRVEGRLAWSPELLKKGLALGRLETELSLSGVDPARISRHARAMNIRGRIKAQGGEKAQGFDLALSAEGMSLAAQGEQRAGVLRICQASLDAGSARAEASGTLALGGGRAFSLAARVMHFDPRRFLKDSPAAELNASLQAKGRLLPSWAGQASLVLEPSHFAGQPLEGRAQASFAPGRLSEADVDLAMLGNRLKLQGAIGALSDELAFELDSPHLERFGHGLGGALKASGAVSGGLDNPHGKLLAKGQDLRAPGGWRLSRLELDARLQPGAEGHFEAKATLGALSQGEKKRVERLEFKASGTRAHHTLVASANLPGDQTLSARAEGGWQAARWQGQLQALDLQGPLDFSLEKPASLSLSAKQGSLGFARFLGRREGSGQIELTQTEWSSEHLIAKGRMSGLQIGFSLDEYQRTVFQGKSLQLGATWDVELADQPRGLVHVFREEGDFVLQGDTPVALGLENLDLNLAISDGRLALSALANGKRIGAFNAVVSFALKGRGSQTRIDKDAPMVGVLNADMPSIAWLGPLASQNMRTEGSLKAQFNITGTPDKPQSAGFIQGEQLAISLIEQGMRLDQGQLGLSFDAEKLRVETLSFRSPQRMPPPDARLEAPVANGTLTGSGELELASGKGAFALKLDRIATLQNPGQWLIVSGNAALASTWESLDVRAKLRSDAGFVGMSRSGAPSLSEDVKVRGREKPAQRLKLNADVSFDFGDSFILKAYGVDAGLEGLLRVQLAQGTSAKASGSIRTREGFFNAYGQKLDIERGTVNFHGPLNDPGLNILARRRGLEVEAGVEVTGTAQRPKVRLVSEPNVPDQEKLAWILFGRPSEGSAADIGVLLSTTGVSLTGDGEGLSSKIASGIGLDSLGIANSTNGPRQGLKSSVANNAVGASAGSVGAGTEGDKMSNQVLSVGKRLGARTYLSFEQNFLGTESVLKLSYSLTRLFSLVARAGTDNALDLTYSISFR